MLDRVLHLSDLVIRIIGLQEGLVDLLAECLQFGNIFVIRSDSGTFALILT